MLHVVWWSRLLRCAWCRQVPLLRGVGVAVAVFVRCVVLRVPLLCGMGVAVAVFAPRMVSQLRSLRRVVSPGTVIAWHGCRGCRLCAAYGVVGAVVAPWVVWRLRSLHRGVGVAVAIFVWHVVLRVPSLHGVGVAVAVFAPRVVLWSRSL